MKHKHFLSSAIISLLIVLSLLVSCSSTLTLSQFDTWDIHTEEQAAYLASEDYTKPHEFGARGAKEMSRPVSPTFQWKYGGGLKGNVVSATLLFADNQNMDNAKSYPVDGAATTLAFENGELNLKVNATYFWQLILDLKDGTTLESEVCSFNTQSGPRNMYIDGVTNVRDMGGYTTLDGATIRQGLLFRTGRYNTNYYLKKQITEKGLSQMEELGIRTDIDLRGDKTTIKKESYYANGYIVNTLEKMESPLGSDVEYVFIPTSWNSTLLSGSAGWDMIKKEFEVFADESKYPIAFHCSIGTDRTGVSAFLVGCALGMNDDDLTRDYLFSNFANIESPRLYSDFTTSMRSIIKDCEGNNYSEKGINYLLKIGVTQEQIDSLRRIMLEY